MRPSKTDARSVFEVVIDAKVYRVAGKALQRLIVRQRAELSEAEGLAVQAAPDDRMKALHATPAPGTSGLRPVSFHNHLRAAFDTAGLGSRWE